MADQLGALLHTQQQALSHMQAEGLLDEQFQQLLALQDETNPDFVTEVAELYFDDAVPKIQRIGQLLSEPSPDFGELDAVVHQFKGSSASLGAGGMAKLCIRMRELCQQRDVAGCQALVMQVGRGAARDRGGASSSVLHFYKRSPLLRLHTAETQQSWSEACSARSDSHCNERTNPDRCRSSPPPHHHHHPAPLPPTAPQMQEHFVRLKQQLQGYLQLESQRKQLAGGG
jgi:histidine-containing phosphotransfer protein